jgi:hypothetical protein
MLDDVREKTFGARRYDYTTRCLLDIMLITSSTMPPSGKEIRGKPFGPTIGKSRSGTLSLSKRSSPPTRRSQPRMDFP